MHKKTIWPYLLVAPALLIVILVIFIPAANAVLMSFQSYDLRRSQEIQFIGLQNYADVLSDVLFWKALFRTGLLVVVGVGLQFVFGFLLALLLNRKFRGRGIARSISLIPWVTPGVLIALIWRWILDGNYGVLNDLLLRLGLIQEKIPFLARIDTAFPSVVLTIVWQGIPFFCLMLLAGLQGVPSELYEAAEIDGANAVQTFFRITVPSVKNTIFVTTMLRIIWVANSVDIIYNMTAGGPAYSTQTLSVYIFDKGSKLNLSYASTMSILLTILLLCITIPYVRKIFREEEKLS